MLQDLTGQTRAVDQVSGCSRAEARAVGAELARLHAAYWQHPDLPGASWLFNRKRGAAQAAATQLAAAAEFRGRYTGRIAPACLDAIDHFAVHAESIVRELPEGATLIHGEPRVDNVLFEDLAEGHRAWLIDWQFADHGSPMFDLAYFLAGSVSAEDRRAIEDELIAAHQAVISTVDPSYSLDRARAEFKACLPIALHFSAGAVLAIPAGDASDRLLITLVERNVAALTDWQCFRP